MFEYLNNKIISKTKKKYLKKKPSRQMLVFAVNMKTIYQVTI